MSVSFCIEEEYGSSIINYPQFQSFNDRPSLIGSVSKSSLLAMFDMRFAQLASREKSLVLAGSVRAIVLRFTFTFCLHVSLVQRRIGQELYDIPRLSPFNDRPAVMAQSVSRHGCDA